MRSLIGKLALAALGLTAISSAANAYVVISITDTGVPASTSCDTSQAQSATNCYFDAMTNKGFIGYVLNSNAITFNGTVGGFGVVFTSGIGNQPGTPALGRLNTSSTAVEYNGPAATGHLDVSLVGYDYSLPAGNLKNFSGSASTSSQDFAAGDQMISDFYVDPNNTGALTNMLSCTVAVTTNNSCNAGTIEWADNGGLYSIRSLQSWVVASGGSATGTTTAAVTPVPEPGTAALFGLSLLGIGFAARRRTAA